MSMLHGWSDPARLQTAQPTAKTLPQTHRVRFNLIDKIEEVSDHRLVAVKHVTLAEEYLADHFPAFPVLPGVLMLEAMTQAAGWLLHRHSGFAKSIAVLREAKNIKYGTFVAPGNALRVDVEAIKILESGGSFKASGMVGTDAAVSARLELAYLNVASFDPNGGPQIDRRLIEHNRARWSILTQSGGSIAV